MIGERKLVTLMVADLAGSTAAVDGTDPEDADSYLTDALGGMMDAIHLYEGTVNTLRGDGLMALFGAPIAHEDHAVRAALAALAIPETVANATAGRGQTRVGLHSGEVLVREIGNDLSVEYQAQGPTVHIAARMEELAEPGTTFVTDEVRRLIEGHIETQHVGPAELKGISQPVEAYRLIRSRASSHWQARASKPLSSFTGRLRELEELNLASNDVRTHRGRVVVVVGEAGIGKSRLLHEFLDGGSLQDFRVLKAEASPFESKSPYYPIRELLRAWAQDAAGDQLTQGRLRTALEGLHNELGTVAPALASLTETAIEDKDWTELAPGERKRRTRDAVRALIHALARKRPLAIVVEDLHWIDGETQNVLDDLVGVTAGLPVLLLFTQRPEYKHPWSGQTQVKEIKLEPLARQSSGELLDYLVGSDPSVHTLKSALVARVGGIPLFLEESVRTLVEAGALSGNRGAYVAAGNAEPMDIPDTVQGILAARIDRLNPKEKHILQVASVAGQDVPVNLLCAVTGQREDQVLDALSTLQARDLVYEHRVIPTPEFRFSHSLVWEVGYRSLPKRQRRQIHAAMVDALEAADTTGSLERLAYHAVRSEMWQKAADYSQQAAEKSIDQSAFREASAFLRDAAHSLEHLTQDRSTVEASIDVRMAMRVAETGAPGGLARLVKELRRAGELASSIGDKARQRRVAIHAGFVANMQGNVPEAESQAARAFELARESGDRYVEVESRILLAQTYSYCGRPCDVRPLLLPHMDYLTRDIRHETMGQTMVRSVVACAHLTMTDAAQARFDTAAKWEDEGAAIAEETGRPFDRMYMQYSRGVRLDFEGRPEEAVLAHERSAEIAEANDIWFMMTFAQPRRGHALYMAGRLDEALEVLSTTEAAARRVELPFVEAECRGVAGLIRSAQGDAHAAREDAEAALAFGRRYAAPLLELLGLRALGQVEEALAVAERWNYRVWADQLREAEDR
jgi:class 3 adenylate cyclase/tetratricopeptide (TPR) repeat protein